ncbi:hypothetical protein M758_11G141900 [Ceratodon purpureus]|uniref:Uncharacterized protein n=1 Tax=Ceratodon purpureus TaxID=3225 RepID=A0A8T0GE14_CERPU|nr:hypothetical protein KC19_11G146200 [Ceratodon purpureus]KAG0601838.1 hypothetical protein M758_11G141900 [Ceratodon purpureus]
MNHWKTPIKHKNAQHYPGCRQTLKPNSKTNNHSPPSDTTNSNYCKATAITIRIVKKGKIQPSSVQCGNQGGEVPRSSSILHRTGRSEHPNRSASELSSFIPP